MYVTVQTHEPYSTVRRLLIPNFTVLSSVKNGQCFNVNEKLLSLLVTHIPLVDPPILINWTSPFPILGVSGVLAQFKGGPINPGIPYTMQEVPDKI